MSCRAPLAAALVWTVSCTVASPQAEPERLRNAKVLLFDHKYAEARQEWQTILAGARGPDAEEAAYWIAHCSEKLGQLDRAFREYAEYLARKPASDFRVEEARTARVGLAARLYKSGRKDHLPVLTGALRDPSRTVRYYAALQLADLGRDVGRPAVPVLKEIVEQERDDDLVARAKVQLLRVAPEALGDVGGPREPRRKEARFVKVRIFKRGQDKPEVSINLPLAFAEMVFKSLPDEARQALDREGIDADNFWKRLREMGPQEILKIESRSGELIQIWLE